MNATNTHGENIMTNLETIIETLEENYSSSKRMTWHDFGNVKKAFVISNNFDVVLTDSDTLNWAKSEYSHREIQNELTIEEVEYLLK